MLPFLRRPLSDDVSSRIRRVEDWLGQFAADSSHDALAQQLAEHRGGAVTIAAPDNLDDLDDVTTIDAIAGQILAKSATDWVARFLLDDSDAPTSYLHLHAGTAAAATNPLKFVSGTVNTTPEAGAVEYNGTFISFLRLLAREVAVLTATPGAPEDSKFIKWDQASGTWVYAAAGAGAPVIWPFLTKTGNYNLLTTDFLIYADASGGSFTLTLPTAVGTAGQAQSYLVKRIDTVVANTVSVTTTLAQTIEGAAPPVVLTPGTALGFASNNANWLIW